MTIVDQLSTKYILTINNRVWPVMSINNHYEPKTNND
jgi:hypothetical protein